MAASGLVKEETNMSTTEYFEILKQRYESLGEHPTREQLHEYNEFRRQLRKELDTDETDT